jgi:hypothetical protein
MTNIVDEVLKDFATDRQKEYIDAINQAGSIKGGARLLGVPRQNLQDGLKAVKRKAAIQGYAPDYNLKQIVPEPYIATGHSTLYKDNKPVIQWVKTKLDTQAYLDAIKEAVTQFVLDIPAMSVIEAPLDYQTDIIPWIQIGDAHLGMLAHCSEIGENFDLKIAETEICAAIGILIDELPNCERLVINDLGDFTHYENFSATTEASGHALDYDTRFPKMITVYSRVMRFIVEKALTKAQNVDVIVNQGNHSRTNDIWMAELLRVAYGHTKRVNVLNNDNVFIAYRMGNTLVMTHHSDKCKPSMLANVMTSDFRRDYGETEHHYIDIGHVHHGMVMKEHPSIFIESFNHLASLDRWAHDSGYRNRKSITIIKRSKKYGDLGRRVLPIQEIRDRLSNAMNRNVVENKPVFTV